MTSLENKFEASKRETERQRERERERERERKKRKERKISSSSSSSKESSAAQPGIASNLFKCRPRRRLRLPASLDKSNKGLRQARGYARPPLVQDGKTQVICIDDGVIVVPGPPLGCNLPQNNAKGVHVRAICVRLAHQDLRRHPQRRAHLARQRGLHWDVVCPGE
jgi:hypothetical protein